MNRNSTYAFYGSLRRGMENHAHFREGLAWLFTEVIGGFRLYALENYPYAVRTNAPSDRITVEVCRVTNPGMERAIHELETEVGYHYDEVVIREQPVGIYLFHSAGPEALVKSGDWVEFFGSR